MREYLTVTELNKHIDHLMQTDVILSDLWLKGEISGFKHHRQSGHCYFTLKDRDSSVSCVMFRSQARRASITPQDGMEVIARGAVSVYAPQGKYQLYVQELRPYGIGAWQIYLEKIREKCQAAGYFDVERKKTIPGQVNRVGIITSQDGAALQDILKIIRQRHRRCQVILVHSAVQGNDAPRELAEGLRLLNEHGGVEVIILGRGGGSWEDLMPFNTETVVEAIFNSRIPVITAIGHEVDFSLADLAADLRAATPTQAGVLAVPDMNLLESALSKQQERLIAAVTRKLTRNMENLDRIMMKKVWKDPAQLIKQHYDRLQQAELGLNQAMTTLTEQKSVRLALLTAGLDGVSPLKTMQRGYALIKSGPAVVTRGEQVELGGELQVCMQDADLKVKVMEKEAVSRWKI
jgi:exodeoxyribonuclease VII large subunit